MHSRCKAVRICILKTAAILHIITQFPGCVNPNAANAVQYKIYSFLKANLTLEEAAAYSGIGTGKLREITNDRNCNFVLWVGNKRLIKKRLFDKFIEQVFSI